MDKEFEKKIKTGLTEQEVQAKRDAGLVNGDLNVKTKSYKQIIFDNLFSLFNLVNTILVVCVIAVGSWKNAMFYLVVIWNFLLGCAQEIRAKRTIDKLSLISAPKANVLRDGELTEIAVSDIVLGDTMALKSGNQICADAVVLEGDCQVNESLITGESTPILKKAGDHLLSGSFLISGSVLTEVEHVGEENYVNKITLGAKYYKKPTSVIMKSVKTIVRVVAIALIPIAGLLIWKNFFVIDQPVSDATVKVVAAISAMIPGGLVLLVSVVLAVSVIRLSAHKTLVQDLYSVENLARVDVLCLDKTGTITEGNLHVDSIVPIDMKTDVQIPEERLKHFASVMDDENSTIDAIRAYFDISVSEHEKSEDVRVIPFSSEAKWSLLYEKGKGSTIMGAPEFVCPDKMKEYRFIIENYTKQAKRVLLLAESEEMPSDDEGRASIDGRHLPSSVTPVAFIVMGDKVRSDAKQTLQYFEEQGVVLKVISGDSPQTVSKVAAEAGLKGYEKWIDAQSLTSYEEIEQAVDEYTIFGRVSPYQKLDIIKALKAHGHTVAMTGDGANDVLALKEADCSIAMQSGSDAARNVSNMVLMDSNFASLPLVVAEGRKSINNLQRSAALYLTKTTYAFILGIVFLFLVYAYPFESIQVTLIGGCTIGLSSFFLAFEPNNNRIKRHFLRNVFTPAVPSGVMTAAAIIAVTVIANRNLGADSMEVGTIATMTALIAGFTVVFNVSGKMNLWKWALLGFIILVAVLAILILPGLFDLVPLTSPMIWLIVITGVIFFVLHTLIFRLVLPRLEER
ncbi:MAG: HAD-IC family P-type ATPase [Parasporobacterium sp.]|nr:HAD-IC family P-type ATPase [Parasporobacterium sp.]